MRLPQFDAPKKSLGQAFEKAKQERNWFIFGLYEPKNGKIGKRPVLRSRPWITIGAQNAARLIYDEAVEFLEGVTKDAKHIKKYNKIMLELARGADNEARPMIGLALGYLARPGSAMVMCDLDDVLDPETGELTEDGAKEWGDLLELYEGYAEISSSKTGLRLLLPREEGDEEKSSASEIGSGCFVAKGEKGMVLTFDIWKDNGKLVSDDFGAVEIVDKIVSDREAARARRGRVGGAGDANWGDLGDAQAAFDEWGLIDLAQLHEILEAVPNEGIGREEWIGLMLAIGLLSSWLGTLCWNRASSLLPTSLAGQLIVFETLAAMAYGFMHHTAWPQPWDWAGMALLVAGVVVGTRVFVRPA